MSIIIKYLIIIIYRLLDHVNMLNILSYESYDHIILVLLVGNYEL
jgi:hypothetical protein